MKWLKKRSKHSAQASGYLIASGVALASDMAITLTAGVWLAPAVAAALGFTLGTFVSYWLAKKWAFSGANSAREFLGYFAVGLLTLGQTTGMVYLLTAYASWSLFFSKCAAIPVSFVVGFVLRHRLTEGGAQ